VSELWSAVVEHLRDSGSEVLSSVYEGARAIAVDAEERLLTIGFPASAPFNKRRAEGRANADRFADSVQAIVGERLRPVYELLEPDPEADAAVEAPDVSEEELLELIKTKFDAREVVDDDQRRAEG
jgi:hypothetical protein